MPFRRDTKSRRTDRTPDYGWSGRAAARQDAGASRSESRLWAAVVERGQESEQPDQTKKTPVTRTAGPKWVR
jgi:hypothetical protein